MNSKNLWNNFEPKIFVLSNSESFINELKKKLKYKIIMLNSKNKKYYEIDKLIKISNVIIVDMEHSDKLLFYVGNTSKICFLYNSNYEDQFTKFVANKKMCPIFDDVSEMLTSAIKFLGVKKNGV